MKKAHILLSFIFISWFSLCAQKPINISSPDGCLTANIHLTEKINFSIDFKGKEIISASPISIELANGKIIGKLPKIISIKTKAINAELKNVINGRRKSIRDNYNELTINFRNDYSVIFRAYNEGIAYRFITSIKDSITIKNEEVTFNFPTQSSIYYIPKVQFDNSGEGSYLYQEITEIPDSVYALTPAVVQIQDGPKIAITESSLFDYAGLNLKKNPTAVYSLIGNFAPEVEKEEPNGWYYKIKKRRNYLAHTAGSREFPWRIMIVTNNDLQLVDCDLVYKLAKPSVDYNDLSWIKPGKAAWDWWADWSIQGVDFKGEQESYEYYKYLIDFAAAHKLEYVEVSVGWMNDQDIMKLSPKIRMPELIAYAESKNIGIMVWVVAQTLERQFEEAFQLFTKLGVAGIKVDFLDADHQGRINFYEKIAKECMKRKLMVYYHGACKPTGLERTYPCIINYEGVQANEHNKWSKDETPKHSVNVAFIRNLAGPMDMNCGAMRNGQGDAFAVSNSMPMSQGTRCHQLAMYVSYFSPFTMVCDAPDTYIADKKCIELISSIPTDWDNSKAIEGAIGEFIIMARAKGDKWFVSGLNNEVQRSGNINLSFLGSGVYNAVIFEDGINANKVGTDYKISTCELTAKSIFPYNMANGGGFVMKITKKKQ